MNSHLERPEALRVAAFQLTSVDSVSKNVDAIETLFKKCELSSLDLVCLPENALYLRMKEGEKIPAIALDHPELRRLADLARGWKTAIHVGSIPAPGAGEKLYNSTVLISADGQISEIYRKIHLFDVDVEGHKPVRESDAFAGGATSAIFEICGWKIGSSICYDLRFAELYSIYAKAGVDAIVIPSAFLVPTGKAHWETLTRARAIESQCYVVAAAQGGTHHGIQGGTRSTYGHSIVVDPWGDVIASLPDDFGDERIIRANLSKARIAKVRAQIPMAGHRRL